MIRLNLSAEIGNHTFADMFSNLTSKIVEGCFFYIPFPTAGGGKI
jgi:hypothetical protein